MAEKEKLPAGLLADFISRSWAEVGALKSEIESIKAEYKGSKELEEILQNLVDSYLIAIGQLETFVDNKGYIELPEEDDKALKEDVQIDNIEKVVIFNEPVETKVDEDAEATKPEETDLPVADKKTADVEPFEYFVDFDEPTADKEADAEIEEAFDLFK